MQTVRNKIYNLLRLSEGFFKSDMVYVAKGGFWLSVGQAAAMLSGFILSIAFANLLQKESFGVYKFILSMVGILGIFSLTGLSTSIVQSVASGFESSLRRGFYLNIKWSAGIFLGGLGLSIYYLVNNNLVLSFAFILAGISIPLTTSANLYSAYLLGKKDFRRNSIYGIARNLLPATALLAVLFLTQSLPVIIFTYFLSSALVSIALYKATASIKKNTHQESDPELLSYSGHLSAMDVIGRIASFLDKILVFHYLGAAPLAIYAFAIAPIEQLQGGKKIISTLIQPKFAERPFDEIQKTASRKAIILTLYALALAAGYSILAPYFFKLFYPQYLESVFYSQIYSLTLLAISGTVFNEALIAHKKKKELYIYRTITPILQIFLFIFLLPLFGLMGLIVTHIVIRTLNGLIGYYLVKRPFKEASSS